MWTELNILASLKLVDSFRRLQQKHSIVHPSLALLSGTFVRSGSHWKGLKETQHPLTWRGNTSLLVEAVGLPQNHSGLPVVESAVDIHAARLARACTLRRAHVRSQVQCSYLVDPASSHMLVSKIKPCMSKYKLLDGETANGSLNQL